MPWLCEVYSNVAMRSLLGDYLKRNNKKMKGGEGGHTRRWRCAAR